MTALLIEFLLRTAPKYISGPFRRRPSTTKSTEDRLEWWEKKKGYADSNQQARQSPVIPALRLVTFSSVLCTLRLNSVRKWRFFEEDAEITEKGTKIMNQKFDILDFEVPTTFTFLKKSMDFFKEPDERCGPCTFRSTKRS